GMASSAVAPNKAPASTVASAAPASSARPASAAPAVAQPVAQAAAAASSAPRNAPPPAAPTQLTHAPSAYPVDSGVAQPLISGDWAQAYSEVQRQTADVHATYMNAMASSHLAFLD